MPIYEYSCTSCHARFQKLVRGFSTPAGLTCPRCHSQHVQRLISRFATLKSEEARLDALADPATFAGLDENDPRAVAQWARKLGKELGEDAGDDWDEMVDEMLETELSSTDDTEKDPPKPDDNLGWA
jgi:putative FmdB family regulatory protein